MTALYENDKWRVTERGLESRDPAHPYVIKARLLDTVTHSRPLGRVYDPPVHLARKSWVDIDAFLDAYGHALDTLSGRLRRPVDRALLARSFGIARRVAGTVRRDERTVASPAAARSALHMAG